MRSAAVDTVAGFSWSLVLILASILMLSVVEFNARHIFANAGVVDPTTHGFAEWLAYMQRHSAQFCDFLRSFWSLLVLIILAAPLLAILILWDRPKQQLQIVIALLAGATLDLLLLLQYYGYNSGNGGYDGGEGLILLFLHSAFGVLSLLVASGWTLWARYADLAQPAT